MWQRPESLTWSALSLGSVRESNIVAAKAVADAVRTSLGPRGMDKMVPPARLTLRGLRGEGRIRPAQGDLFAAPWSSPLTMPLPCPAAQISSPKGEVVITNDGATILKQMQVAHPTARCWSTCQSRRTWRRVTARRP